MSQDAQQPPAAAATEEAPPARYLLDSNILLRLSEPSSKHHAPAKRAVNELEKSGAFLCITAQNLVEFWAVATKSKAENGLGLPSITASAELARHRASYIFIADHPAIFPQWERLIQAYGVQGTWAHDTRLVATALVYNVENILTFNTKDFNPFSPEGLNIIDPRTVPNFAPPKGQK